MKSVRIAALIAGLALGASPLLASVIGPVYPAPGGNGFSSSGASGDPGGATLNYSSFDPTQYSQLFWGLTDVQNVYNSNFAPSGTGNMTFVGYNPGTGVAEYDSTVNWFYTDGLGGAHSYQTRLLLTFAPANLGSVTTQSAAGISGATDPVLDVTGNYSVNAEFEADVNGIWTPVDTEYNSVGEACGSCVETSFDGGFWYTPASSATPEPGTLMLFGTGLFTVAGAIRRKFNRG